jgi:hypothetical protein
VIGFRTALIGCIALGGMVITASASDDVRVAVVGRPAPGLVVPVQTPTPGHRLTQISTMNRHMVGVMEHEDAVLPGLVQLQMGNIPIYVDPDQNFGRRTGGIDDGHMIMRAQRAYDAPDVPDHAYVIRRGALEPMPQRNTIMPRAILIRPDYMQRRDGQRPMTPTPAPRTPKVDPGPVASAK